MGTFNRQEVKGFTNPAWIAAVGAKPKGRKRPGDAPAMNGTERDYNQHLAIMQAGGAIKSFLFNRIRLKIALGEKAAWVKLDFFVWPADGGRIEIHETKGYERPAALLRLKVAAGMYPQFRFRLVKRQGDQWSFEEFKPGQDPQ